MTNIKYGLISDVDKRILEKVIEDIAGDFDKLVLDVTEIGIYSGETGKGIKECFESFGNECFLRGIDNNKDREPIRFVYDILIKGNSNEVHHKVFDDSQHMIFIDACHCFTCVISDFFAYAPKVVKGGYMVFHDTGKHIKSFKDFQHGDKENPKAYISVRQALEAIGLFEYEENSVIKYTGFDEWGENDNVKLKNWELIFDEADENDEAGGITVFKRLY